MGAYTITCVKEIYDVNFDENYFGERETFIVESKSLDEAIAKGQEKNGS